MVDVGEKAPDFTAVDTDRKPKSLRDFVGKKLLLAFYPGAFTPVCTREMCTFRDSLAKLSAVGAQVVALSVNDPFTVKAFADANRLSFPLLSDYNREAINRYGIAHNDFAGLKGYTAAKRSVFILDEKSVVRYKWVSDDPTKEPNYDEVTKTLSQLK